MTIPKLAVCSIAIALFAYSVSLTWQNFGLLQQLTEAEHRFEHSSGEIQRLFETARLSANMAVATRGQAWRDQHAKIQAQLQSALRTAGGTATQPGPLTSLSEIERVNQLLADLETRAVSYAVQDRIAAANALLNSTGYWKFKSQFLTGFEESKAAAESALQAQRAQLRDRFKRLIWTVAALVAVLFGAVAATIYAVRKQTAALIATSRQLVETNAQLETRISERTAAIELERQKFRDFAETTSDWFWESNEKLQVESVSDNFVQATGIAKENFVGLNLLELEPSDQHGQMGEESRPDITGRRHLNNMYVMMQSPVRGRIYVRLAARAVRNEAGKFIGHRGTAADITRGLARTRAATQGQKLQALGTMAAGLAHEFNNILAIVLGYTESLRHTMRGDANAVAELDQIAEAGRRGSSLSKSLLSFGRSSRAQTHEVFNVRALGVELPPLLKPLLGPGYTLAVESADRPLWVSGDRDLLLQSVVNLVVNARDAMPKGGTITLSLGTEPPDSERLRRAALPAGQEYLTVKVTDTGTGMDRETVRRIFDPFFTTKKAGHGTGLGLALLFSFVKDHKGHVDVESELNVGTSFVILLPLSAPPQSQSLASRGAATGDFTGMRALVVDDEPQLVAIFANMLRGLGFDVVAHPDMDAALEVLDDEKQKIDVIVSDVLMPQMSGFRFAELACSLRPSIDVLFVTGQPERGDDEADAVPANAKLLRKPFDRSQLSIALGDLLAAKAAA
ncbi:MAG: ATP-binding protein [Micropepsaceae bacterium]